MAKPEPTDALDRLYAAPLEDFVALRRALATELRASDPAGSRVVAGATKPTRTAWALNQAARHDAARLRALVEARDEAAKAQKRGDAAHIREASRAYRDAVHAVVHAARAALERAGFDASAAQVRRMAETLQAATAEHGPARAQLLAGRLVRDVPIEDPFAGLEPGPPRPAKPTVAPQAHGAAEERTRAERATEQRRRAQRAQEEEARAKREAEAALAAARARVAGLEEEARVARREARQAEIEATRAQAAADRARARATDVEDRLRRAKEALR